MTARRSRRGDHRPTAGQATVELALLLPVIVVLLLVVGQVALVARDRLLVTHAAREGARAAAVGHPDPVVRDEVVAAGRLDPTRAQIRVSRTADLVEVEVHYTAPTDLPIVGALVAEVALQSVATMRREDRP